MGDRLDDSEPTMGGREYLREDAGRDVECARLSGRKSRSGFCESVQVVVGDRARPGARIVDRPTVSA